MPYLKLFHGRKRPDEQLEDWGKPGPIFGPFPFFHATYGCEIKFDNGVGHVLKIVGDLVYYNGLFYGDWSVFEGPIGDEDAHRLTVFDDAKAEVPERHQPCDCEQPGYFNSGVPGVLAHLENGRLPLDAKVERCDQCQRYPDDPAARKKLIELGRVWQSDEMTNRYSVLCYVTVAVRLPTLEACSHQEAARKAGELFDWDQHQKLAEFADEMNEFLVDIEGDLDFSRSCRFNADFEEIEV